MRRSAVFLAFAVLALRCGSSPDAPESGPADAAIETSTEGGAEAGASCTDGIKNGAETDVDCGGPTCAKCKDGSACALATDCASQSCSAGICGVREWSVESQGNDLVIPPSVPGDQIWTSADPSGLYLQPNLYASSVVFLQWTGALRYVSGPNGICHVGQRFVVDDVPTGDPSWGNAIMVQNGATRWHEIFTTEQAMPLGPGLHTIGVQMVEATGYATCELDGDTGAGYDRSRLTVAAYDPKDVWYVESSGDTGPLVNSPFVDIPGESLSITLSEASHVQISMSGTQDVATVPPGFPGAGYCSYRLVIDGTPEGDPTYGQALVISDTAAGWWEPVSLKYGLDMTAGAHTIKAQIANPSTSAACDAGQGNNPYARFRMFVSKSKQGGPSTSVESTGGPTIVGANGAWTPVGLSAQFKVGAPTPAQLEMSAIQETTTGSSGQCSWHFVIDGSPLGDPNNGQTINVGDASTSWWTTTSLLWGQTFAAGSHTVSVEVRNSSNTGDCGTNGDAKSYGRARLLVRVP
ncbi:MAG TPA: hypothetical protein VGH28_00560 [Polyangiaceae bacterium]|jgi:hypothetical protein